MADEVLAWQTGLAKPASSINSMVKDVQRSTSRTMSTVESLASLSISTKHSRSNIDSIR